MFPVANDFVAIARRLKEIQVEAAIAQAVANARHQYDEEHPAEKRDALDDISACA